MEKEREREKEWKARGKERREKIRISLKQTQINKKVYWQKLYPSVGAFTCSLS